jgi:hypothetical protein
MEVFSIAKSDQWSVFHGNFNSIVINWQSGTQSYDINFMNMGILNLLADVLQVDKS